MRKISDITSTATPDGEFTNGSVASGVSPTILDAAWFNVIQRELVNIVTSAGLTLDAANDKQILAALQKLFPSLDSVSKKQPLDATLTALAALATGANKLPYFTGTDTVTQTDLTPVGRDIIGKSAVADVLTYLGLGEAAKRAVGTGSNQIPDMGSFLAQRGGSWYRQHPSGMIEQGGQFSVSGSAAAQKVTVNLPIPFPNACVGIWMCYQTEDPSSRFAGVYTKSQTNFVSSIVCPTANTIYFRAEGY